MISTGGGVVLNRDNKYSLAQNGMIFCIERQLSRLATDGRPLSKGLDELEKMYAERKASYDYFSDAVIDNNGDFQDTVNRIAEVFKNEAIGYKRT